MPVQYTEAALTYMQISPIYAVLSVFWEFDGQMSINDGKIAVSFRKLDLKAFYDRCQEYMQAEAAAEEEKDPEKQAEIKKAARSSFEEWMDSYTLP